MIYHERLFLAFYNLYPVSLIAASYFTLSVARRAASPRTLACSPWLTVATVSGWSMAVENT